MLQVLIVSLMFYGVVKIIAGACSGRDVMIPGSSGRGPNGAPARVMRAREACIAFIVFGIILIGPFLVALLLPR